MKILLLGTHGQLNLGDELQLETFLSQLGSEHQYVVNSHNPVSTQTTMRPKFDVESFHITSELPRFLKHLLESDLLFFGGGGIIKELHASTGRNPYSRLLMILATVTFAKQIARKSVMMSNIGVGPLTTSNAERLARWILNQVDFLSVRDERSHQTALRLGFSPLKVNLVPHAVFANPPEVFVPDPQPLPPFDKIRIALNLNYAIENRAAWEPFLASLAASLTEINATTPLEIHALPMQSNFKANDDLSVLKEFSKRIPDISFIVHTPQTSQAAAEIIANVDMVLAERLHALAISSILGKPFMGLAYDMKVKELIDYLGMSQYSLNINLPFSSHELTGGIQRVFQNRQTLRTHLLKRSESLRESLRRYFNEVKVKALTQ